MCLSSNLATEYPIGWRQMWEHWRLPEFHHFCVHQNQPAGFPLHERVSLFLNFQVQAETDIQADGILTVKLPGNPDRRCWVTRDSAQIIIHAGFDASLTVIRVTVTHGSA